ncbi:hypothetical protein LTR62_001175 [Meristemomyces frigidus]|uniref:F-box domain-containing protein n=1 Tax=Meristemomyces frigidus TaxID=1508187 RepID=A0AAN7TND1_9PEZI|nr:hypothetical protein LTR62_001175 [Meristemomyces frigidus]
MNTGPLLNLLPPELRLEIYSYALKNENILLKPIREPPIWDEVQQDSQTSLAEISLLCTSRLITREARQVFYEINSFSISYNHLCCCENRYPYPVLDNNVSSVIITSFMPRESANPCIFCREGGYGLLQYLNRLPKLTHANLSFQEIFTFTEYAPNLLAQLRKHNQVTVVSHEVGVIDVLGQHLSLQFELPVLRRAWATLAQARTSNHAGSRVPGEQTMRTALEYLQFETNVYDRTASSLLPFFTASEEDGTLSLQFSGVKDGPQRRADFTLALAAVLYDVFADDGGSDSIAWADVTGSGTWTFVR